MQRHCPSAGCSPEVLCTGVLRGRARGDTGSLPLHFLVLPTSPQQCFFIPAVMRGLTFHFSNIPVAILNTLSTPARQPLPEARVPAARDLESKLPSRVSGELRPHLCAASGVPLLLFSLPTSGQPIPYIKILPLKITGIRSVFLMRPGLAEGTRCFSTPFIAKGNFQIF